MQTLIESAEPAGCVDSSAAVAPDAIPGGVNPCVTPADLVYDLRAGAGSSDGCYDDAANFTDKLLAEIELRAGQVVAGYRRHVQEQLREAEHSPAEHALDLLLLGLALGRYRQAAEETPGWVRAAAHELYWLRRKSPRLKPVADLCRAALNRLLLVPESGRKRQPQPYTLEQLPRLIDWMQATGEFEQEVRRLNNWRSYLGTLASAETGRAMELSVETFAWFEREAVVALGVYTRGVEPFLAAERAAHGLREDRIFRGRPPVEYHLAMVAAEVMNRGLRERFEQMPHKAVLVPVCMRGERAASCRARVQGVDMTCTGCDPACSVNRITRRMRRLGAKVYLVPHSSGFSRWLERWQHEPETGVVAAACLLNIVPGGYEMRARGIASQCVPLDYPGCQKHWRREGIPTRLNEDRLVRIAASPSRG